MLLISDRLVEIGKPNSNMRGVSGGADGRTRLPMQRSKKCRFQSLGQEDPPEKGMATHSSILAWRIPWTEEPEEL